MPIRLALRRSHLRLLSPEAKEPPPPNPLPPWGLRADLGHSQRRQLRLSRHRLCSTMLILRPTPDRTSRQIPMTKRGFTSTTHSRPSESSSSPSGGSITCAALQWLDRTCLSRRGTVYMVSCLPQTKCSLPVGTVVQMSASRQGLWEGDGP